MKKKVNSVDKREIISYLIVGLLTTVVCLGTYYLVTCTFLDPKNSLELQIANIISWVVAVIFAYFTNRKYVFKSKGIPKCTCGGNIKPDVVLYEEGLDPEVMEEAIYEISICDMLIIGGTSLNVYPAAAFINYYKGDKMVLINRGKTPLEYKCTLVINASLFSFSLFK